MGKRHGDWGRMYVCGWRRTPDGLEGWWLERPEVRASAAREGGLVGALTEAIAEETGDMEPAIEFEPAMMKGGVVPVEYFAGGHMKLGSNDSVWEAERCVAGLFEGGECAECHRGRGRRSGAALEVDGAMAGDWVWTYRNSARHLTMVTERVLDLFTGEERGLFECRRVARPGRARKAFHEIVPRDFLEGVAIKGVPVKWSTCWKCENRGFTHFPAVDIMTEFIVAPEDGLPPVFFVGGGRQYGVCLRGDRARALKPALRKLGVSFDPVGAVPPGAVDQASGVAPTGGHHRPQHDLGRETT